MYQGAPARSAARRPLMESMPLIRWANVHKQRNSLERPTHSPSIEPIDPPSRDNALLPTRATLQSAPVDKKSYSASHRKRPQDEASNHQPAQLGYIRCGLFVGNALAP